MEGRSRPLSRGRDEDYSPPPAQIPACAANAPGLYEEAVVKAGGPVSNILGDPYRLPVGTSY
jgi:hypothetical protein